MHGALNQVCQQRALSRRHILSDRPQKHLALLNQNPGLDWGRLETELEKHHVKQLRNQTFPEVCLFPLRGHHQVQDERIGLDHVLVDSKRTIINNLNAVDSSHRCARVALGIKTYN